MEPKYFKTSAAMRAWLHKNHAKESELVAGYFKKGTGKKSITWPESVDEALCFGWIDGIRKRIDEERYTVRFTPRRKGSTWSAVNVGRVRALEAEGRMTDAGRTAFAARTESRTAVYSFESFQKEFDGDLLEMLRSDEAAWRVWQSRTPSYRKTHVHWLMSAKRDDTRRRRMEKLIASLAG